MDRIQNTNRAGAKIARADVPADARTTAGPPRSDPTHRRSYSMPDFSASHVVGGDPLVAQVALEDAPDGVPWKSGPELDVPGEGEVRELLDAPAEEALLVELGALLHRGRDLQVVLGQLARDGVDRDVGQSAVAHEDPLHLEARDVLAAPSQVVGLAVDEVEIAVLVDAADVAGVVPPVPAGLDGHVRPTPVALEHHVGPLGPKDDLAVSSGGHLVVVVVEDPHVEVLVVHYAGGVRPVLHSRRLPRDETGLGDPVHAGERGDAEPLFQHRVDLGRQRRRPDQPQRGVGGRVARARHLGTVDVVGEQVGHGPQGRRDGRADPVHLRPELGDREPLVDRATASRHERAHHRRRQGVEVVERERGPHDVVGRSAPAERDLLGQRLVVAVAEHAALRHAGRPARVDERAEVGRLDRDRLRLQACGQQLVPGVDRHPLKADRPYAAVVAAAILAVASARVTAAVHIAVHIVVRTRGVVVVDHHHVGQVGHAVRHLRYPGPQGPRHHHDPGARVGQLVAQVFALVGGIDGNGHTARAHRADPGQQRGRRVLDERRHPVALLRPQLVERAADTGRGSHHLAGRELRAGHIEVLAVGVVPEAAFEECGDGRLRGVRPGPVAHANIICK